MERIVRKSKSFAEDDRATKAYYAQLSPDQRLDILFELIARVRGDKSEAEQ